MNCISLVSFSFIINGHPVSSVSPTRGIRQEDPLSPYLFLIVSEGLSNLIKQAAMQGRITGMSISKLGPEVTHLLFADDSLLFCKAEANQVRNIKDILTKYEAEICQILHGVVEHTHSKYLGLPLVVGRSKKQVFAYLKERITKKMSNWKTKLLSEAGKEVMLKSVIQAIPVYTMSVFKLPVGLCKDIAKQTAQFWWNKGEADRKVHWIAWQQLTVSKEEGGLGLKDVADFNKALLAKKVWRLMTKPNLLLSKVMKAKYFPTSSIFQAQSKARDSCFWRNWNEAKELLREGCRWKVGNGVSIKVWEDKWFNDGPWEKPHSPKPENCTILTVNELLD